MGWLPSARAPDTASLSRARALLYCPFVLGLECSMQGSRLGLSEASTQGPGPYPSGFGTRRRVHPPVAGVRGGSTHLGVGLGGTGPQASGDWNSSQSQCDKRRQHHRRQLLDLQLAIVLFVHRKGIANGGRADRSSRPSIAFDGALPSASRAGGPCAESGVTLGA